MVSVYRVVVCIVVSVLSCPVAALAQEQSLAGTEYNGVYSDSYSSSDVHPYYGGPTNPFYTGSPKDGEAFVRGWQGYTDHFVDSGMYLTGMAGFAIMQDQTSIGQPNRRDDVSFGGGEAAGGGFGYRLGRYRYEAVFEYRSDTVDTLLFNGNPFVARGFSRSHSGMLNFHIDFMPLANGITPYIGAGIGIAEIDEDIRYGAARLTDTDVVFAYQAIGGFSKRFKKMEHFEWFAEFRYFATTEPELNRFGGPAPAVNTLLTSEYQSIGAMFGFRLDLFK